MSTEILWKLPAEIAPCPCGTAGLRLAAEKQGHSVRCENCGRRGPCRKQPVAALNAWNSRAMRGAL